MKNIDWREFVHSDPEILVGKPVVRGTRLSIEFILGLFAEGWSEKQVLDNYPILNKEKLQAVFAFATDCLREEALYPIPAEAT
jgi:uncharacterized protein (DUF433 family)